MSIQEPEKAIKAFENALEINPKDSDLACRIAEALVTTHEYQVLKSSTPAPSLVWKPSNQHQKFVEHTKNTT